MPILAGDLIYEWDQQLEEVNMYIPLPERLPTKLLYCTIKPKHLELGIKGNPPFLNVRVRSDLLLLCHMLLNHYDGLFFGMSFVVHECLFAM